MESDWLPISSRTLLSTLADPSNVVVWLVSAHPLIFKSSSRLMKLLRDRSERTNYNFQGKF